MYSTPNIKVFSPKAPFAFKPCTARHRPHCQFCQNPLTHHLDDAAIALRNQRHEDSLPPHRESSQCARLMVFHETPATNDMGGQYYAKAALGACFSQMS
jgi:hypothetical protein